MPDSAEKKDEALRFDEGPPAASKPHAALAVSSLGKPMNDASREEKEGLQEIESPAAFRPEAFALFGKKITTAAVAAAVTPTAEAPTDPFGERELAGIKTMIHKLSTNQMTPSKATYSNATKDLTQPRAKDQSNAARAEEKATRRADAAALAKANADAARVKGRAAAEAKRGGAKAAAQTAPGPSAEAKEPPVRKVAGNKAGRSPEGAMAFDFEQSAAFHSASSQVK